MEKAIDARPSETEGEARDEGSARLRSQPPIDLSAYRIVYGTRRRKLFTIEEFHAEIEAQIRHFYKCYETVGQVDLPFRSAVQKAIADAEEIAYKKIQRTVKRRISRAKKKEGGAAVT